MTSLALDILQPLFTTGFMALAIVKLVMIVVKYIQPAIASVLENREDAVRRTLVYLGFVVDDENDDK